MSSRNELIVDETGEDSSKDRWASIERLELHSVVAIPVSKLTRLEALNATITKRPSELLGVLLDVFGVPFGIDGRSF